jgi:hypothetical protein
MDRERGDGGTVTASFAKGRSSLTRSVRKETPMRSTLICTLLALAGLAPLAAQDSVIADLKRERAQANEATAVADLRAIVSAEHFYSSSANFGHFDTLSCLVAPGKCIPGYPVSGITFLSQDMMGEKSGYRRKFHAGAKVANPGRDASPSSMAAFALTAVPIRAGETGVRGFCVDYSNIVCFTPDGTEPRVVDGTCPVNKGCEPVTPVIKTSEAASEVALRAALDAVSSPPALDDQTRLELVRRMRESAGRRQSSESQEVCARHILVKVESPPRAGHPEAEARSRAQVVLTSFRAGTDFAELARKFSEDASSASGGGDLGCFSRGVQVREFEDVAFALKVGETSDLVRTVFGFHVIQRTTRGVPKN